MNEHTIADYRLEIIVLQQRDTNLAKENGCRNKKEWFDFIKNSETDDTALAIINIAKRYDLPLERVAHDFDSTMIIRVGAILDRQTKQEQKGKAA